MGNLHIDLSKAWLRKFDDPIFEAPVMTYKVLQPGQKVKFNDDGTETIEPVTEPTGAPPESSQSPLTEDKAE